MWKVRGRSSALNRAQGLLEAKRGGGGGGGGSTLDSPTKGAQGVSFEPRSVPPTSHILLSDLSDLSSDSSAAQHGAAEAARPANTQEDPSKELRPRSSVGEGSRFLKKPVEPASRNQAAQPAGEPRNVSSSQHGSRAPAWRRLAEIESRVRSRKQELDQAKQPAAADLRLTSNLETSAAAEASAELSARSVGDQSQRGNRFLKKTTAGAAERSRATPPEAARPAPAAIRSESRARDHAGGSGELQSNPVGVRRAVSLESDEEDMKKLLGDSSESVSLIGTGRPHRTLSSPKAETPASPASGRPSSPSSAAPPRSPASPSFRGSPFRFSGRAQAQFSPSGLSPLASPPSVPPSHPEGQGSSWKTASPQRSHSSSSGQAEVLSLEDLFPVGPGVEEPLSLKSSAPSEEFQINVKTLEELVPTAAGTASGQQLGMTSVIYDESDQLKHLPEQNQNKILGSQGGHREGEDYRRDFNSDSSTRQISEHLGDDDDDDDDGGEEAEVGSEVKRDVTGTDADYSSSFSESICSQRSETVSRTCSSRSSSHCSRRCAPVRRNFKDAAAQTGPDSWSAGMAPAEPIVGRLYMQPAAALLHSIPAERLEAISALDPAASALNEMLKQQLAAAMRFMEHSEQLHRCLLHSLEPPSYRYTTLQETLQNICSHREARAARRFCKM